MGAFVEVRKINNDKIRLFMEREVPNFNFMDIKQQFVFLMINEDINIISFISDIIYENFQMREKMVWYVESPIVLRCTLFALIYIYALCFFYLQSSMGIPTLYNRSYLPLYSRWNLENYVQIKTTLINIMSK